MEHFDLIVVGAGWHGLAMAKTYIEVHNQASILVLDYADSVGGTWASERLYPGLKTNNVVGTYEFSDFPLVTEKYGIEKGQHIPGEVVHAYLSDFCQTFGLMSRIQFSTRVESATLLPNGEWEVAFTTSTTETESRGTLIATKLVLATGLTSQPFMPPLPGKDVFKGLVFHAKDFKKRARELSDMKTVVVIGGNKSAWDVCYSSATRFGAQAHMVMRRLGGGPSWCWPPRMKGVIPSISVASATRLFTWLDPNPYGRSTWPIRALINRTWLGRKLSQLFWRHLDNKVTKLNAYDQNPGMAVLKPWTSTFWMGNSLSVHNYETNWFDLVRSEQITAHAGEVSSLSESGVRLTDGTTIEADAVICCTGWETKPNLQFFPEDIVNKLGFPGSGKEEPVLEAQVRADILQAAPVLREKPVKHLPRSLRQEQTNMTTSEEPPSSMPYRLHRFILPCHPDFIRMKNLAVIGAHITLHTAILSQVQSLWITALFDDKIPHLALGSPKALELDAIKREAYHHTEYQKIRRPKEAGGTGERCPDLVFDSIPYVDMLLFDLDLSYHRKPTWYREITEPYTLADFRGLVREWTRKTK
ncbi:hypothetical protein ACKLNR_007298 [Fusarium oxysporum f. sp. zingiberi]